MEEKFRYFLWFLVLGFIFFAGAISKYSEFIWISHSYLFALIILLIFVVFSLWLIFTQQTINKETFSPIVWGTIIIFIILIFTSQVKYDSIFETYRIVAPIFLFLVVINIIRSEKEWKNFSYTFVAFGVFIGILSYIQFYIGPGFGTMALYSIWGYQNTFAAFLVLMIILSFGIYLEIENRNAKMLFSTIPMFFIFLLFLTVSRGGYIALFITIISFIIISRKNKLKAILKESIPIIVGSALLIIVGSPKEIILANLGKGSVLVNFVEGGQDFSLGMRIYMAKTAFKIFLNKPIFGYGLGTFRYTYALFNQEDLFRIDPHSLFFKFLAETGIVGTLTFFSLVGYFFTKSFVRIERQGTSFIYKGLFAGLLGMIFHMCIDVDVYPIMFVILFFGLALLVNQEFIELRFFQKKVLAIVSIILVLIISINLFPRTVASFCAVKGENPSSLKQVSASIEYVKKAIKIDPKSSQYQFMLGDLIAKSITSYDDTEKLKQMNDAYNMAYELNKLDYRAPFRIGIDYLFDRAPKAITYLEEAKNLYPTNPNILSWLSVAYAYIDKDNTKAQLYLLEAEKYNHSSFGLDFSFAKGALELAKGNKKEADEYFSTLAFYDEIYKQFDMLPKTYAEGRYALQLKIIRDLTNELNGG